MKTRPRGLVATRSKGPSGLERDGQQITASPVIGTSLMYAWNTRSGINRCLRSEYVAATPSLSRAQSPRGFLDVQCADFAAGQTLCKYLYYLFLARPPEGEDVGGTTSNRGIEGVRAVCTHDCQNG